MSIDQFSNDVPKALERMSQDETHETRRYSGIAMLKEIALAAPSRYYHLIAPIDQFFEQLFSVMTDSKVYRFVRSIDVYSSCIIVIFSNTYEKHSPMECMQLSSY
jgi:hypothetical protein